MNDMMSDMSGRDMAIDRINRAIDGYATRVATINTRAKSRPTSAHLDSDDAYGQRKASGAANYHRDATLGVDGQLKSSHLVREVSDTLTRGMRRMRRDEARQGEDGVVDRLNKMADHLQPSTLTHDASHHAYANGHGVCKADKQTRHVIREQPHVCNQPLSPLIVIMHLCPLLIWCVLLVIACATCSRAWCFVAQRSAWCRSDWSQW
jgi:hypothetical protein